jgi:3-oxoadipate enol-lactonase
MEILALLLTSAARPDPDYRLPVPALLVHGAQDRVGDIAAEMRVWSQREPLARYAVIPDAGHVSNLDNPAAFTALLTTFLDELLHSDHIAATSGSARGAEKQHRHF